MTDEPTPRRASTAEQVNTADESALRAFLTACCDVPGWVDAVIAGRPYSNDSALLSTADAAGAAIDAAGVDRALAAHPRIGERPTGSAPQACWSRTEQATVSRDEATTSRLAEVNQRYEQRFGRVFLICASGLSAEQILTAAQERLANDEATETRVVADELRKIALLRLERGMQA